MAYTNAWANHRLLTACAQLSQNGFAASRTGFFPSIRATLNHLLTVDQFYMDGPLRENELAELGFNEADIWRPR